MCLGVPGQVTEITSNELGIQMGRVQFGGIQREVCLSFLPEIRVGDYVIVHAGFAISQVDEAEAARTLELLQQMGDLSELPGADTDPKAGGDAVR
jgi:hydrogenase expression/formation protein HypC